MKIRILRSARRTVADGVSFYERQEAGLDVYAILDDRRDVSWIENTLRTIDV